VSGCPRACRPWAAVLLVLACAGCASLDPGKTPAQKLDPFESWNRKVFSFNESLDEAILKPVATAYAEVVPPIVRTGVGNFYANVADAWSAVNNLLQGKPVFAGEVAFRFAVNTVFGFGGVLDLASEMGVERHFEDFGQTLGVWGMGAGAYLMWPLIGPSTIRDSLALPLNYAASPMYLLKIPLAGQFGVWSLQLVNTRAGLLAAGRLLEDIALDKYTFIRDAYLQRRRSLTLDGDESQPEDPSKDDPETLPEGGPSPKPAAPAASDAAE